MRVRTTMTAIPIPSHPIRHPIRSVLQLFLRGTGGGTWRVGRDMGRLRARWIDVAGKIVASESDGEVRELLSGFLRDHLGAAETRYVPSALSMGGLRLGRTGETVEVTLEGGVNWTEEESDLVRRALETTDAVLAGHARLAEVQAQSLTDALTGLHNRRALTQHLQREILLARRHGMPLSVVAVDVDHFKQINDEQGHAAGDDALRAVAMTLTSVLRRSDLVFRHGGDEFIVVLPQTTAAHAAMALEKVLKVQVQPTISAGVAELSGHDDAGTVLRAADDALYAAKRARNTVRTAM